MQRYIQLSIIFVLGNLIPCNSFSLSHTPILISPVSIVNQLKIIPTEYYNPIRDNSIDNLKMRGGEQHPLPDVGRQGIVGQILAAWGILGVLMLLGNAIKRLLPIALQPFYNNDLTSMQWTIYTTWGLFMAYAEGYKGFHQKFSPLVVKRAFTLHNNRSILNIIFAWAYSMGLFAATKKRMIISWSISAGVMVLVMLVKNLSHPWRCIVDGGVVAGLTIGSLSIVYHYIIAIFGKLPDIDACLIESNDINIVTNNKRVD